MLIFYIFFKHSYKFSLFYADYNDLRCFMKISPEEIRMPVAGTFSLNPSSIMSPTTISDY